MTDSHKRKSKFLSLVLRHEPERIGIRLDEAGWVSVDELLEGCRRAGQVMTRDELAQIVRTSDKQRFALSDDGARLLQGTLPTLIQWGETHPASAMPESGVTLHAS